MENQLPTEKQPNQIVKKEWITPEMQEINIKTGGTPNPGEGGGYTYLFS